MHQGRDRADRKADLKPQRDIEQDPDQGIEQREAAVIFELFADLRPDELHPAHLDPLAGFGQQVEDAVADRDIIQARVRRDADQYVLGRTEILDLRVGKFRAGQRRADRLEIDGGGIAGLDQGAAGKIDAEVEAAAGERANRKEDQQARNQRGQPPPGHEIDIKTCLLNRHMRSVSVAARS